jgi:hypothetical protein
MKQTMQGGVAGFIYHTPLHENIRMQIVNGYGSMSSRQKAITR